MVDQPSSVVVIEDYRDWSPPFEMAATVRTLLASVPPRYLVGLHSVVLSSRHRLSRERRRPTRARGRKVPITRCLGLYHRSRRGQQAWVELFADAIVGRLPRLLLRIRLFREAEVASVLFHELGHHIHATQAPEHREPEDVAESWRRKLSRPYFRRRYWYWRPLAVVFGPLFRAIGRRRAASRTKRAESARVAGAHANNSLKRTRYARRLAHIR